MVRQAKRAVLLAAACVFALSSAPVFGQIPKTLRIIVPLSAGGGADIIARLMAEQIGRTQGLTVLVENRPGAGTALATDYVARSEPDGSTLLITNTAFVINPHVREQSYDPLKTFEPICNIVNFPLLVVVKADSPFHTLADLVAAAKANPNALTFASTGPNSASHLAIETLRLAANMEVTYVPFGGSAPAITALLGGHVMAVMADYTSAIEQLKSGALRALAVGSAKRYPNLPDVPTISESGYKDYDQQSWNGFLVPAKTPSAVVTQLQTLFGEAGRSSEVKEKLALQGLLPEVACGADFKAVLAKQYEQFGSVVRAAHLKAQ